MRAYLIISSLLCCVALPAVAQLTPDVYRNEVEAYSWELKSAALSIDKAAQNVAYERVSYLPKLSATGRFAYNIKEIGGERYWGTFVEPQIIQTLYGGGVVRAKVESAELSREIAVNDSEQTRIEIDYAADYAYWNLWAMSRYHAAMEQYVELISRESEVIESRYREGYVAKGDLLMIASRRSEAEYELISASKNREIAEQNLNLLRGVSIEESVTLNNPSSESRPIPQRYSLTEVIDRRPDYSSSLLSQRVAEASTRVVKGGYNPQLTGGVTGSWRVPTINLTGAKSSFADNLNGSVYVALSLPIYHFGERRKASSMARIEERRSEINTSTLLDAITKEESNAWVNLTKSREQMMTAASSLEIASDNLEISTYAYNEGEVSIVELMQAQISWIQIYTNSINSEYNYQIALSYYRRTTGGY